MCKFAVIALCAQALFVQTVFSQCLPINQGFSNQVQLQSPFGSCGSNIVQAPVVSQIQVPSCGYSQSFSSVGSSGNNGGFGGNGVGQLGIVGELPIGGSTLVEGNLPVIGIAEFNGALPAGGYISVVGSTPCQCSNYATSGSAYSNGNICY